jgi:transposase
MRHVNRYAAGGDIGAHELMACVPDGDDHPLVRACGPSTADRDALADWFVDRGIQTTALESTGGYWLPLFETLEARGIQGCLISAQAIKHVPGRKSDVLACQWMQTLHSYGLLKASFRPEADLVALRTLLRPRAHLMQHRAPHVLHMQKALLQMTMQLSQALSDVTGATGQRILRALVAGERDPRPRAALRHSRCQKARDDIARALTGTWRAEQLFVLKQALALFDFYTIQLREGDAQIEGAFSVIQPRFEPAPEKPLPIKPTTPPRQPHAHRKNAPASNTRAHLLRITGVALVAVPGISPSIAQTMRSEIGTDMRKWPDETHCCAGLGLAPNNAISGGKGLKSRTMKTRNRAPQACRMAAQAVLRADCALGAFYRRVKGRLGPAQALVATAHKIARTVYHMLQDRVPYRDLGAAEDNKRFRERALKYLQKKAAKLGDTLSLAD